MTRWGEYGTAHSSHAAHPGRHRGRRELNQPLGLLLGRRNVVTRPGEPLDRVAVVST